MELLDTTLLSNFVRIGRLDLLVTILPEAMTTPQVLAELGEGEAAGWLPESDWEWLGVVTLSANEQTHFEKIREVLGDGEASCLAVARERNGTIITDDRDARRYARRLGVAISGTLGVLALLVKRRILTLPEADSVLQAIINGGPGFSHTPAMSLLINCEDQAEVDELWEKLSDGGEQGQCGWLTDRFGVSWQVFPMALDRLLQDEDEVRTQRVMKAMLSMKKIDLAALESAYTDE